MSKYIPNPGLVETETELEKHAANSIKNPAKAIEETLAERQNTHGRFTDHAIVAQALKREMQNSKNYAECNLSAAHKEALDMIQHKIARILSGDPNVADHWHDIGGYAKLVEDLINRGVL